MDWTANNMKEAELNYLENLQYWVKQWTAEANAIEKSIDGKRHMTDKLDELLDEVMRERLASLRSYISEAEKRLPELFKRTEKMIRLFGSGEVIEFDSKA